jgi:hypothetical protein
MLYSLGILPDRVAYARFAGAGAAPGIERGHHHAKPRRPDLLPAVETKRREPRGPRLGVSPEGGVRGSTDRANAVPGAMDGSQGFQASR